MRWLIWLSTKRFSNIGNPHASSATVYKTVVLYTVWVPILGAYKGTDGACKSLC